MDEHSLSLSDRPKLHAPRKSEKPNSCWISLVSEKRTVRWLSLPGQEMSGVRCPAYWMMVFVPKLMGLIHGWLGAMLDAIAVMMCSKN